MVLAPAAQPLDLSTLRLAHGAHDLDRHVALCLEQEPSAALESSPRLAPTLIEDLGYCALRSDVGGHATCACGATGSRAWLTEHLAYGAARSERAA